MASADTTGRALRWIMFAIWTIESCRFGVMSEFWSLRAERVSHCPMERSARDEGRPVRLESWACRRAVGREPEAAKNGREDCEEDEDSGDRSRRARPPLDCSPQLVADVGQVAAQRNGQRCRRSPDENRKNSSKAPTTTFSWSDSSEISSR